MPSLADLERSYYVDTLGMDGVGKTLNDLRLEFYTNPRGGLKGLERTKFTSGDINPLPDTAGAWAILNQTAPVEPFSVTIDAEIGDRIEVQTNGLIFPHATSKFDLAIIVAGAAERYLSSEAAVPSPDGDPGWYPDNTYLRGKGPKHFDVVADDLEDDTVTVGIAFKGNGANGVFHASSNYPFELVLKNYGVSA
jgi:hypothetical protein